MYLEFIIYIFIAVGFFGGILRGVKKEFFALVSLIGAFACVLFLYKPLVEALRPTFDLKQIYDIEIVGNIVGLFGINEYGFEYLIIGGLLFVIVFAILAITFKQLLFNAKRAAVGKAKEGNRFLGGLVGLFSGVFLALFFMVFFRACFEGNYNLEADANITKYILLDGKIPFLSDKLNELIECVLRK